LKKVKEYKTIFFYYVKLCIDLIYAIFLKKKKIDLTDFNH